MQMFETDSYSDYITIKNLEEELKRLRKENALLHHFVNAVWARAGTIIDELAGEEK